MDEVIIGSINHLWKIESLHYYCISSKSCQQITRPC